MPARTARSIGRISLGLFLSAQFEKEADGQQHIHDTQKRTEVMSLLDQIIESGRTPAEEMLEKFNGVWHGSVEPAYQEYAF